MPIYCFACQECGKTGSVTASMADMPLYMETVCDRRKPEAIHVPGAKDTDVHICRMERTLSAFGGNFGDTPRHHR